MKTRFSSIVHFKHSKMQESEMELQQSLQRLETAKEALAKSLADLGQLSEPSAGNMQEFLASRTLQDAQMRLIEKNREWVAFEEKQVELSREKLKQNVIEYEKFKYLEMQEIEKIKKRLKIAEMKHLDEVAIMTYKQKEAF